MTEIIEININNLAAVPSVVFGIMGLAIFIIAFGLPRSIPLVGGIVLALMTLPTIIISSRAAIRAVPPSIRDAALGVGASKMQTILHHVIPPAMPGMLTGTIIGMAQALGETGTAPDDRNGRIYSRRAWRSDGASYGTPCANFYVG
jgi:phosphate transport system permease protein